MSLFGDLQNAVSGIIGQAEASILPTILDKVLSSTEFGSIDGLISKLTESGLGTEVKSWLSNGPNLPVTAEQLESVLGNSFIEKISSTLNIPQDQISAFLAEHLPAAVHTLGADSAK